MKSGRKNLRRASKEEGLSLQEGQSIMQVVSLRGSNLIEVMDAKGIKSLALFPAKFQRSFWIKRGNFVVVDESGREKALESGSKITCMLSQVLFHDQVRKLERSAEWLVNIFAYLTKHPHSKIQAVASDLLHFWKKVVIDETTNGKRKGNPESKSSVKVEVKSEKAETVKADKISKAGSGKVDKILDSENLKAERKDSDRFVKAETLKSENIKIDAGNECSGQNIKVERISKEKNRDSFVKKPSPVPVGPPKLTSMIKCNDPLRDKLRELLAGAFSKVSSETSADARDEVRNIFDEVDACDPIRVAVMVESAMFEKLGRSNGSQKLKYRSIMFNLKDGKNPDLRRRVLLGQVKPEKLVEMTPEEMASDERKLTNKQIKEKALFECERGEAPRATTDQFKCGRCGQRKCTYLQLQTRSADEPMTAFVTCVNCNNCRHVCRALLLSYSDLIN